MEAGDTALDLLSARPPALQGVLGMSSSLEVEVFYPT